MEDLVQSKDRRDSENAKKQKQKQLPLRELQSSSSKEESATCNIHPKGKIHIEPRKVPVEKEQKVRK